MILTMLTILVQLFFKSIKKIWSQTATEPKHRGRFLEFDSWRNWIKGHVLSPTSLKNAHPRAGIISKKEMDVCIYINWKGRDYRKVIFHCGMCIERNAPVPAVCLVHLQMEATSILYLLPYFPPSNIALGIKKS